MTENKTIHNIVIIGGGCAGYVAGYYSGRANMNPVLIEGTNDYNLTPGGQLTTTTEVENFPAYPEGIDGREAVEKLKTQAIKWGTTIIEKTVTKCDLLSSPFKLYLNDAKESILARTVIIATGATAKRLNIKGEEKYWNFGISACAVCDGALPIFRNKPICVIGGGDTAMEEAMYLSRFGSKVYLINRSQKFRASNVMLSRVKNNSKIEIIPDTVVIEAMGNEKRLQKVLLKNVISGDTRELETSGLFYAIGHTPNTGLFKGQLDIDTDGYIKTDGKTTKTNVKGVFACGDVQDKIYRQAVTAMGSGCSASIDATRYLEENYQ